MLTDLYVLTGSRTAETVERFRKRLLSGFSEAAADYSFPMYKPQRCFSTLGELLPVLLAAPEEDYSLYWNNRDAEDVVRSAMLFFTADGGLIGGLSVADDEPALLADKLALLAEVLGGQLGYVTTEEPPPDTQKEFRAQVKTAPGPKLVDGRVVR